MFRMRPLGLVVVAGLLVSACGGAALSAQKSAKVTDEPLIANATTTGVVVATTPVQAAQNQAVQLAAAEEQYATCFAYGGLDQSLAAGAVSTTTPVAPSCPSAGLTPAEVQQIQDLILQAS